MTNWEIQTRMRASTAENGGLWSELRQRRCTAGRDLPHLGDGATLTPLLSLCYGQPPCRTRGHSTSAIGKHMMSINAPSHVAPRSRHHRWRRWGLLALAAILLWPAQFAFWQYHLKRYQAVDEGVLYRTAQPTELGLRYLVDQKRVKTVLSLQTHKQRLYRGLFDPFDASGAEESEFVTKLGVTHLQWPMGDEWCWPWITPWQFDEFFKLLDDPANLPLTVHCMGGRHRTGTFSALYRLEYDRWPVDRVLTEMYSFQFGHKIPLQEHNLRTYLPRPRPSEAQWSELQKIWGARLGRISPSSYDELVRHLRRNKQEPDEGAAAQDAFATGLKDDELFALCLAARVIDKPDHALAPFAAEAAVRCLEKADVSESDWSVAAALIADFGTPQQQQKLIELLVTGSHETATTARDEAIVAGVTNRYTPNRLAFLRPLLEDQRHYAAASKSMYRYCDTAVVRMAAILDQGLMPKLIDYNVAHWDAGRQLAQQWFADHPQDAALSQLRAPSGKNTVRIGAAPVHNDISRD